MTLEMASPAHPDPLQRALQLAHQALWLTSPNPRVGCVITQPDGTLLGEGHTQRAGGP
ncbi:MAG: Riboflavin biosynthesis protein RibD, partial [Pseudomonadota bacterium]